MKQTIFRYMQGYLCIGLSGASPERFWNLCASKGIFLWEIRREGQEYCFFIRIKDYWKVRPLVRKAGVRLKIRGRHGLPFFIQRNKKRTPYAVGIAVFFLLIGILSQFIWNITIEGNRRFTEDQLLRYLSEQQEIRYGSYKQRIDCDALEEAIRSDYPDVLWVSARVSGTRLLIRIKENEVMRVVPEAEEHPRDLVAERDGVITQMIVRTGTAAAAIGDTVTKGQVLIQGSVSIYDDAEALIAEHEVSADGEVYAVTKQQCITRVSKYITERVYSGGVRRGARLRMGGVELLLQLPKNEEKQWEIVVKQRQFAVLSDFYLPIWIDTITMREYESYERTRTKMETEALKKQISDENLRNLLQKGVQIIQNNVTIKDIGSYLEIQQDLVLEEQIGIGQNRKQEEEWKESDERN